MSKKICEEYLNTKIGIEAIALKYHVGKLKIKQILTKNNMIKNMDWIKN